MQEMRRRKWIKLFLLCATIVVSVGMIGSTTASIRKLPTFILYTFQGKEESLPLSSWSILYFFSPDCFSCFNTIFQIQNEIKEREDVLFFPICSECDWRALKDLRESLPLDFEVYFLSPRDRAVLGVWNTPSLFLLSPSGKVMQRWEGNIDYTKIEKFLSSNTTRKIPSRKTPWSSCSSGGICE